MNSNKKKKKPDSSSGSKTPPSVFYGFVFYFLYTTLRGVLEGTQYPAGAWYIRRSV